jgi:hypothetical protein
MTAPLTIALEAISRSLRSTLLEAPVARALLADSPSRDDFVRFLSQTYWYTRESPLLLREAAAGLRAAGAYPELAAYYEQKAVEESGHEAWALADLRSLGAPADPALLPPPSPAVTTYLRFHHRLIAAGKPLGFFGAAWILESLGSGAGAIVERLRARSDLPGIAGALRFLSGHGAADVHHLDELADRLAGVEDPGHRRTILVSAKVTAALYPRFFRAASGEVPPPRAVSDRGEHRAGGRHRRRSTRDTSRRRWRPATG